MKKATYQELRTNVGYRKLPLIAYRFTGDESDEFLDTRLTKNVEFANEMSASFQFLLNEDGDVKAEITLYKLEGELIIFSDTDLTEFKNEANNSKLDVKAELLNELALIQIEGKESPRIAAEFYEPYDISTLSFHMVTESKFENEKIYMSRFGFTGEYGYQFLLPKNLITTFLKTKLKAVPEFDQELSDFVSLEVGQPLKKLYENPEYNLFELGYFWNIDFTKAEFLGRDALIEQMKNSKKIAVGFESDSSLLGENVMFEDKKVGDVIVEYKNLNENSKFLGLLMLDSEYSQAGIHFETDSGKTFKTLSSPYKIPESW